MLSGLLACVLVVGALASKPGMPTGATRGGTQDHLQDHHHEPQNCCAPRQFTFDQVTTSTSVKDGKISVEVDNAEAVYDSVFQRAAFKLVVGLFNGTKIHLRSISLFEEGVSYLIHEHPGGSVCFKGKTEGNFPLDCLTEDYTYVNKVTLGDHDMVLEYWYRSSDDGNVHTIRSVQVNGCSPVGMLIRQFDPVTGREVRLVESRVYNIRMGICDPDEYFKLPESCHEERALKEHTPEMVKSQCKSFFHRY